MYGQQEQSAYNRYFDLNIEISGGSYSPLRGPCCLHPTKARLRFTEGIMLVLQRAQVSQKSRCLVCGKPSLSIICAVCATHLNIDALHNVIQNMRERKIHPTSLH